MAILTFSTPVSGVNSYSGGLSYGPLEALYTGPESDGATFIKYPRDLESSTRSHSVLFTIKEIQEVGLTELAGIFESGIQSISDKFKNTDIAAAGRAAIDAAKQVAGADNSDSESSAENTISGKIISRTQELGVGVDELRQKAANRRTKTKGFIALYMPENLSFSYDAQYGDNVTLASIAGATPLVGRVASTISGTLQENDLVKFILNKAGYVFNPEAQVLFNGITFRSFTMNFTFTPYSKREAEDVRRIIKMFRSNAAPKRVTQGGGMFFVPPSIFNINFNFKGRNNTFLNKVGDCVIENIEVNYTPNGWSAHDDGSPIQTTVTIQFKEIVLVDRDMIEKQGY